MTGSETMTASKVSGRHIQVGTSDSTVGREFPVSPDTLTDIERDETATNSYLNFQWEGVWDSSTSIARLTHTRQEVTDNYDPGPFSLDLGPGPPIPGVTTYIDFDRDSDRTELEFIQTNDLDEAIRVVYDPTKVTYDRLLEVFGKLYRK